MAPICDSSSTNLQLTEYDNDADESVCVFVGDGESKRDRLTVRKALRVVEYATKTIQQLNNSKEYQAQKDKASQPPQDVHHSQIEKGDLLGQGTFSDVFEIKSPSVEPIDPKRYVVKMLREKMVNDAGLFAACAAGLATEAAILSTLNHENIIRVKAWSHRGVCGYSNGKNDAFFVVLDRLDEMLTDRFTGWKHQADKLRYSVRYRHLKMDQFFHSRLEVAKDLSAALAYLHGHRIIHRDIKPANIGFQNGTLKLLDFDIARVLPKETEVGQHFNLTATTGTRPYMSPECGLAEPYNEKTDVYSFAILLNEIISLEKAFISLSKREHELRVLRHGLRPSVPFSCPKHIRLLIQHSWAREIDLRPSMKEIHEVLVNELQGAPIAEVGSPSGRRRLCFQPFKMLKIIPPATSIA